MHTHISPRGWYVYMVEIEKLTSTFVDILLAFTGMLAMQKSNNKNKFHTNCLMTFLINNFYGFLKKKVLTWFNQNNKNFFFNTDSKTSYHVPGYNKYIYSIYCYIYGNLVSLLLLLHIWTMDVLSQQWGEDISHFFIFWYYTITYISTIVTCWAQSTSLFI